jgi:ribosomal protein S18 acetylase RimI-like enzyme
VIRTATAADRDTLSASLARSFHDDPIATFCLPSDRRRPKQLVRFYRHRLDTLIEDELVFCDEQRRGGALWAAPDRWRVPVREMLRNPTITRRAPRVLWGFARLDAMHPEEPHFYLAVLGVAPEAQGEGLGSRLLQPMLDRCDTEGVPAYLESSKQRNLAFYERHGFRVTNQLRFARGPQLWTMWRDPR